MPQLSTNLPHETFRILRTHAIAEGGTLASLARRILNAWAREASGAASRDAAKHTRRQRR